MKKLFLLFYILSLSSCSTENKKEKEMKEAQIKHENQLSNCINDIKSKYHISYVLDSLSYRFSDDYEKVINSQYQLISSYKLKDIYKVNDSIFCVFVLLNELEIKNKTYLKLYCDKSTKSKLTGSDMLVVSLVKIRKFNYAFTAECDNDDDKYCNSYIEMEDILNCEPFIGYGVIYDVFQIDKTYN